ncbi:amino acid ABC transporter permease [Petroclostridium sp. X23]|uniref:amino acid ABC transporter permease n=1 Tax=Petroclostridium sp. X23 TaxID=3045146 RepID=UPI0024AE28DA|nr:amino acid ABC transporter permease [Petroclostridium sp. X23]WHH58124.1 amino acid ABC transporter permease [Petroclostridium sp. X23]
MDYLIKITIPILQGATVTLQLFFITILLSIPLGLVIALMRISKFKFLKDFTSIYVWLWRGTPLLLQLLFVYYGLPFVPVIGPFFRFDAFTAAVATFSLNYAAYFAEIFRAGIESIDKGQYEASKVLGMTYWQTMKRIILPQVIKRVLPPVSNETITLVKDTALVYAIALVELSREAKIAAVRDFTTLPFVVAAVVYLAMTLVLTIVFKKLEQRYAIYE